MSITTTDLGPNSCIISYFNESSVNPIAVAVNNWLITHGWELHDSVSATNKVYKAICAGGITYKYLQITYANGWCYLDTYELWNATTHAGTNKATNVTATGFYFNVSGSGVIHIFANARYCMFLSKHGSSYNVPCGIFEVARENPLDTEAQGYPTFCIANLGSFGTTITSQFCYFCAFPRNRTSTGNNSYYYTAANSMIHSGTQYSIINAAGLDVHGKPNASSWYIHARLTADSADEYRGRMYGAIHLSPNYGNQMDKIKIKVDANGFTDMNGTDGDYFIISQNNGGLRMAIPV